MKEKIENIIKDIKEKLLDFVKLDFPKIKIVEDSSKKAKIWYNYNTGVLGFNGTELSNVSDDELYSFVAHEVCHALERQGKPELFGSKELNDLCKLAEDVNDEELQDLCDTLRTYIEVLHNNWIDDNVVSELLGDVNECDGDIYKVIKKVLAKSKTIPELRHFWTDDMLDRFEDSLYFYSYGGHTDDGVSKDDWNFYKELLEDILDIKIPVVEG